MNLLILFEAKYWTLVCSLDISCFLWFNANCSTEMGYVAWFHHLVNKMYAVFGRPIAVFHYLDARWRRVGGGIDSTRLAEIIDS